MTTSKIFSEDQMVNLIRNSLLVAGDEMGKQGDHWPVIKTTINDVMTGYEEIKIERNISNEIKKYFEQSIKDFETIRNEATDPILRADAEESLQSIRDIYEAQFTEVSAEDIAEEDYPICIKRAEAIIQTLEADNA